MLKRKHETFLSDNRPIASRRRRRWHLWRSSHGGSMDRPKAPASPWIFEALISGQGECLRKKSLSVLGPWFVYIPPWHPKDFFCGKYRLTEAHLPLSFSKQSLVAHLSSSRFFDLVIEFLDSLFLRNKLDFKFTVSDLLSAPTSKFTSTYGMGRP
jgi:hypothetical protein